MRGENLSVEGWVLVNYGCLEATLMRIGLEARDGQYYTTLQ